MGGLDHFLGTFFDAAVMAKYLPAILQGTLVTIEVGLGVIVTGILSGLVLACLRALRLRVLSWAIIGFADIFRALPPLILMLLLYFGLPAVEIRLSALAVLFLVLSLVLAAVAEEVFWAALTAIDKGQWEAGLATGLGFGGTLAYVAIPQALRLATPPLVNRMLTITKMTALGSVIGVSETLSAATTAQSFSGSATPLTLAAIAYLVVFLPFVALVRAVERRLAPGAGRKEA
ncbi:ABC transporter permease subunit [Rhodovastum atsumiense]|uniref:ABC transporter permease subunit n=1 Tax=Rhodovastum atsumiense TaxID=504468 RepID=A0A5M6IV32_9PROT|nr:ABC transporter permease subunit [Rhodovastum atsumiense]KAA5612166.1 ABC transporter permease subunit [Rhodovastum atsumiense]CAH2603884.1 ABC transporter permease subunit [Rhodovastum atsumiense]